MVEMKRADALVIPAQDTASTRLSDELVLLVPPALRDVLGSAGLAVISAVRGYVEVGASVVTALKRDDRVSPGPSRERFGPVSLDAMYLDVVPVQPMANRRRAAIQPSRHGSD